MNRLPIGLVLESAVVQLVLIKPLSTQDLLQFDSVSSSLVAGHQGDIFEVDGETEGGTLLLLLLVEVGEVGSLGEDEDEESSPTCDVDLETGKVVRVLLGEVNLGSDDLIGRCGVSVTEWRMALNTSATHVSDTLEHKHDGGSTNSLSRSSSVQVGPSVKKSCGRWIASQFNVTFS